MAEPNPRSFVDHLNVLDCSKVSDGASAIAIVSEEGLKRAGIPASAAVEIVGIGQVEADLTVAAGRPHARSRRRGAPWRRRSRRRASAVAPVATVETHDCFTIAGILAVEAIGLAGRRQGAGLRARGPDRRAAGACRSTRPAA